MHIIYLRVREAPLLIRTMSRRLLPAGAIAFALADQSSPLPIPFSGFALLVLHYLRDPDELPEILAVDGISRGVTTLPKNLLYVLTLTTSV